MAKPTKFLITQIEAAFIEKMEGKRKRFHNVLNLKYLPECVKLVIRTDYWFKGFDSKNLTIDVGKSWRKLVIL